MSERTSDERLEEIRVVLQEARNDLGQVEFLRFLDELLDRLCRVWAGQIARGWSAGQTR